MSLVIQAFVYLTLSHGPTAAEAVTQACKDDCRASAKTCQTECRVLKGEVKKDCLAYCTTQLQSCEQTCQ